MTDYNDGQWHGWNGGACPVHPESIVALVFPDRTHTNNSRAGDWFWDGALLFKVVKPYVEPPKPREVWVVFSGGWPFSVWNSHESAEQSHAYSAYNDAQIVHMREVTE